MKRTYQQDWTEIFGDPEDTRSSPPDAEEFNYIEPPASAPSETDWKSTRALSIRQPYAELTMLGEKDTEYRTRATGVRAHPFFDQGP